VAAELGATIVKCPYTGDPEGFREVVRSCPVPVLIAGGPKADSDAAVLAMVRGAMEAGAAGASIGRNIFSHRDPLAMTRAIVDVITPGAAPRVSA
jgi:fructose-bisphosphate aldolase/2-amino-3,7-dideoxy-D-threo-hept-6-ulosonate synthase